MICKVCSGKMIVFNIDNKYYIKNCCYLNRYTPENTNGLRCDFPNPYVNIYVNVNHVQLSTLIYKNEIHIVVEVPHYIVNMIGESDYNLIKLKADYKYEDIISKHKKMKAKMKRYYKAHNKLYINMFTKCIEHNYLDTFNNDTDDIINNDTDDIINNDTKGIDDEFVLLDEYYN